MNLAKAYSYNILHNTSHDIVFTAQNIEEVLPKEFVNSFAELSAMPVFDIADRIYNIFNLSLLKDQSAYICAFYDYMNEFLSNNISGIEDFIEEWDSKLYEKTIQSDEVDGIRIISIHKSKGLEFDNVIIPLCDWQMEQRSTIWCEKSDVDPYDKLPIVPIEYSKNNMMGTVYEKDYKICDDIACRMLYGNRSEQLFGRTGHIKLLYLQGRDDIRLSQQPSAVQPVQDRG